MLECHNVTVVTHCNIVYIAMLPCLHNVILYMLYHNVIVATEVPGVHGNDPLVACILK